MVKSFSVDPSAHLQKDIPFLRTPFNYDRNAASDASALFCDPDTDEGRSKTKQEFAQECDPKYVVDRMLRGEDVTLPARTPHYGDFTGMPDFHTAMNIVADGRSAFMDLPHEIRTHYDNDPGKFMAALHDPKKEAELIELGFAVPRAVEAAPGDTPSPAPVKPSKKVVSGATEGESGDE